MDVELLPNRQTVLERLQARVVGPVCGPLPREVLLLEQAIPANAVHASKRMVAAV